MNHDQDGNPALDPSDAPALPAITDPDAVTRALGVQVHLIRTQFVRDRLASGQCTAQQIVWMLEWERLAHENRRMNWHGRVSAFDRRCISLELRASLRVSPEQYDDARYLDEECDTIWKIRRDEDRSAAASAIAALQRLGERLQAEVDRLRVGPDRSAAGVTGALLRGPDAPPVFPPLEPEARHALVEAMQSECAAALAARERLRSWCEDLARRQAAWETERSAVDPTGQLLGSKVDQAVSEIDHDIAGYYELMHRVWDAVQSARRTLGLLAEALASEDPR